MSIFRSKAETLDVLSQQGLKSARILPLVYFSKKSWDQDSDACLTKVCATLGQTPYIVRSSACDEDQLVQSNAGAYLSVKDVSWQDLGSAIEDVFASYGNPAPHDLVLVQPMLQNVLRSGVIFSHDPTSAAPYRIMSWSSAGDTDVVTKGEDGSKTFISHASQVAAEPAEIKGINALLAELGQLTGEAPLDIEFAFAEHTGDPILWLLQVRPLLVSGSTVEVSAHCGELRRIENYLKTNMQPHPFLMGNTTVYSVMADWNPAEIVGLRPRPLAKSLYRELITDNVWAYQRNNYGYRNLRSFPLMVELGGLPYIDVRVSFNSFVPQDLPDVLAEKLVNFYLGKLVNHPFLSDKVEFDIVYSCYTLDLAQRLPELLAHGFSTDEIEQLKASLTSLTNKILHPEHGLMVSDAKRVETL